MDRRELTTTREYRNGKLHITRSDGKVYCVVCKKFRHIEKGNCCPECMEIFGGAAHPSQLPLAPEPDPSSYITKIQKQGCIRGSRHSY